MAKATAAKRKSQSLNIRLDEKTRFILDFIARIKGQNITSFIEQAIKEGADNAIIYHSDKDLNIYSTWQDYWDPSEGVRFLKMMCDPDLKGKYSTFEEDDLFDFIEKHQEFFYSYSFSSDWTPHTEYLDVLWPDIETFKQDWDSSKSNSRWQTGTLMAEKLKSAGVTPPEWPRPPKSLDDEIPF